MIAEPRVVPVRGSKNHLMFTIKWLKIKYNSNLHPLSFNCSFVKIHSRTSPYAWVLEQLSIVTNELSESAILLKKYIN